MNLIHGATAQILQYFVIAFTKKYWLFSARATRKEFWSFVIASKIILATAFGIGVFLAGALGATKEVSLNFVIALSLLFSSIVFLPAAAVAVRRFHDVGLSGWYLLALLSVSAFDPLACGMAIFCVSLLPSMKSDNLWGCRVSSP